MEGIIKNLVGKRYLEMKMTILYMTEEDEEIKKILQYVIWLRMREMIKEESVYILIYILITIKNVCVSKEIKEALERKGDERVTRLLWLIEREKMIEKKWEEIEHKFRTTSGEIIKILIKGIRRKELRKLEKIVKTYNNGYISKITKENIERSERSELERINMLNQSNLSMSTVDVKKEEKEIHDRLVRLVRIFGRRLLEYMGVELIRIDKFKEMKREMKMLYYVDCYGKIEGMIKHMKKLYEEKELIAVKKMLIKKKCEKKIREEHGEMERMYENIDMNRMIQKYLSKKNGNII